jgi:branched-chain amino acid transport system permease protein
MWTQLIVNTLVTWGTLFIVSLGFGLVYKCSRAFHFSYAASVALGPYLTYALVRYCNANLLLSAATAILISGFAGLLVGLLVYGPMQTRKASPLMHLLASLGVYLVLQNTISLAFGDEAKTLAPIFVRRSVELLGATVTACQLGMVFTGVLVLLGAHVLIFQTALGRAIRAVSVDSELSRISGLYVLRTTVITFAVANSIGALAGVWMAVDTSMSPTMGMHALMMGVVALLIGGVDSIRGTALGAFFLALVRNLGAWFLGAEWQDACAFLVLVIFLVACPDGFFGNPFKSRRVQL